jgi:16S rRNA U1498 N3-methylase RsmE
VNTAPEKQPEQEQPVEGTVKLHILSDDRLNSLITKANELGITDVIQIISSDKYGQFYMIYRA